MERARIYWIQATLATFFKDELAALANGTTLPSTHPFTRLTAYLDHQGIARVGGRLQHSELSHDGKHPIILPRDSRFSALLIDHAHRQTVHGGTQSTLAFLRQRYWILGGRAPVKTHILGCVKCARQRGIRAHQLMGQLHLCVTPSCPFTHTGVDYAGPLTLKTWKGRGAEAQKRWICVFVCFATSAVHLEVVTDYSADAFIAAYRRFAARRGAAASVYSDCGTNFQGADAQLKKQFKDSTCENQDIAALLAKDGTQWHFNPPAAPHMGGKWEAVVKSLKFYLKRTIGNALLTFEESITLLAQIEAILNSRPLEPLSDDPDDVSALSPGHFLIGSPPNAVPVPTLLDISVNRLQLLQPRLQQFWRLWSTQYLQRLQAISKWHHPSNEIKLGSLVLITDERLPPGKWPMARVLSLMPGNDGLTRVVTLKTATTTLTRPIAKLAPLHQPSQDNADTQTTSSTSR
ncbi:uncharacterized protein LOC114881533 [Osmia bicornis bicornis]|uniref:uncharacterized protein LOC114881533 n=1 Tax=Osmia bicornis bicornis TaxID=1437191 RepID=UPI001EAF006B|nr:uncharacterized protein LOC114881533 [Osmia bicornis bicornis]